MLTDKQLRMLKAAEKVYKVADQQGLYVTVLRTGNISFRYDYRLNGRRETLVIGQYDPSVAAKNPRDLSTLEYGMSLSLAEARLLLSQAKRAIEQGDSPSRAKVEKRIEANEGMNFGKWAEKYFAEAKLASSTRDMRKAVYDRNLATEFGRLKLEEITPSRLLARCEKIKERGAPAPAVQSRDIVLQIFRFIQARGLKIENPAEAIRPSAIATFKVRDRALSPEEIHKYFNALEEVSSAATLRLAVKFMLLTMVRKSEFTQAKWEEVNFETGVWTIPKERMKAGRPHNVYLSRQAIDILVAFKTCYAASPYLHPGRYESDFPMSNGTLNRLVVGGTEVIIARGEEFEPFTVHDLRRTASTILHEAGYNTDWIEKCLAHEQRGVRAVYNKAEYAEQRRAMLQDWADMVDSWINDGPSPVKPVKVAYLSESRLDDEREAQPA
ncbi:tyrosine-type recombinase/integrase [Burkholderia cenocepacia]|jgi:integrase|uniref:tyrosine-type recombinase/integrase n=1 Tax=Burkholderia cenocepacia TaxID=95486 RepID=UPI0024B7B140|nr:site-specific integrase [Burkholderia cenocepacia]MDI9689956.1 tyrosine-type recombinase/integrase [Burkholderia cenocepacia]